MSDNGSTPVTVDMIRPYLTGRGAVEVDLAVERLRVRVLSTENQRLVAEAEAELEGAPDADPEL